MGVSLFFIYLSHFYNYEIIGEIQIILVIQSASEESSAAKRKICALRLDVSAGYSQQLGLRIEPTVLLLREYMRYATLASKLLRFALTT